MRLIENVKTRGLKTRGLSSIEERPLMPENMET